MQINFSYWCLYKALSVKTKAKTKPVAPRKRNFVDDWLALDRCKLWLQKKIIPGTKDCGAWCKACAGCIENKKSSLEAHASTDKHLGKMVEYEKKACRKRENGAVDGPNTRPSHNLGNTQHFLVVSKAAPKLSGRRHARCFQSSIALSNYC